jgi:signal transduction histidine kinase
MPETPGTPRTAAIRGGEIVRQLMTYGGEESSAFEPIDLSLLVHEILQLLKVSISKHAILETELGEGLPAVHGNPAQIRQVVMNLVTNTSEAIGDRAEVAPPAGSVYQLLKKARVEVFY